MTYAAAFRPPAPPPPREGGRGQRRDVVAKPGDLRRLAPRRTAASPYQAGPPRPSRSDARVHPDSILAVRLFVPTHSGCMTRPRLEKNRRPTRRAAGSCGRLASGLETRPLQGGGSCRDACSSAPSSWRPPSAGFAGTRSARAQDWTDYLHWPYVPPQVPGNGFEYNAAVRRLVPVPPRAADRAADPGAVLPELLRRQPHPRDPATPTAVTTGTRRNSTRAITSSSTCSDRIARTARPRVPRVHRKSCGTRRCPPGRGHSPLDSITIKTDRPAPPAVCAVRVRSFGSR